MPGVSLAWSTSAFLLLASFEYQSLKIAIDTSNNAQSTCLAEYMSAVLCDPVISMVFWECTYLITPLQAFTMKTWAGLQRTGGGLSCKPFCAEMQCPRNQKTHLQEEVKDRGWWKKRRKKKVIFWISAFLLRRTGSSVDHRSPTFTNHPSQSLSLWSAWLLTLCNKLYIRWSVGTSYLCSSDLTICASINHYVRALSTLPDL